MLLILLHWFLVGYISYTIGFATRGVFIDRNETCGVGISTLWGMFIISLISTIFLFFVPAGWFLLAGFFSAAVVIHIVYRRALRRSLRLLTSRFTSKWQLFFGCVLVFCLLVFSAQSSKINDDGYYYIQTMMWFSEVGFVQGISNLMLPLGLASSWHVMQVLFSFDFLDGVRFNDLNGLLVFVFFVFCVENEFHRRESGVVPFLMATVLVISVPFLSAPSPDLPIIVFTAVGFYLVLKGVDNRTTIDVLMLAAFAVTIKFSAVALALLGIVLLFSSVTQRIVIPPRFYFLLLLTAILICAKNVYQTGYPFYPYAWLDIQELPWTTPKELLTYYAAGIKSWGLQEKIYRGPMRDWHNPGILETVQLLWERPGLKGVIHKLILLSFPLILLTVVCDIYRKSARTAARWLLVCVHAIFVLNFVIWLVLAPQYRFILPIYIFYASYSIWWWSERLLTERIRNRTQLIPYAAILLLFYLSLYPVSLELNATSSHIGKIDAFNLQTALKPHVSYSFEGLDTLTVNGNHYYHVRGNSYCWDSPLPCMSVAYYDFVKELGYELEGEKRKCFVLKAKVFEGEADR